jgi:hypothetical protein
VRYRLDQDPYFDNVERDMIRAAAATATSYLEENPEAEAYVRAQESAELGNIGWIPIAIAAVSAVSSAVQGYRAQRTAAKKAKEEQKLIEREVAAAERESAARIEAMTDPWYSRWYVIVPTAGVAAIGIYALVRFVAKKKR